MNWYNYVGSDPVNFVDPLGLEMCLDGSGDICSTAPCPGQWVCLSLDGIDDSYWILTAQNLCRDFGFRCRSPGEVIVEEVPQIIEEAVDEFICGLPVLNLGIGFTGATIGGGASETLGITLDAGNGRVTGYSTSSILVGAASPGRSLVVGVGGPSGSSTSGSTTITGEYLVGGSVSRGDDGSISVAAFRAGPEARLSVGRDITVSKTIFGGEKDKCPVR